MRLGCTVGTEHQDKKNIYKLSNSVPETGLIFSIDEYLTLKFCLLPQAKINCIAMEIQSSSQFCNKLSVATICGGN